MTTCGFMKPTWVSYHAVRAEWVVLGVAVVLGGCATPQMTAGDLAKRADQNMLEAQQNLAGKKVIVRGVVSRPRWRHNRARRCRAWSWVEGRWV